MSARDRTPLTIGLSSSPTALALDPLGARVLAGAFDELVSIDAETGQPMVEYDLGGVDEAKPPARARKRRKRRIAHDAAAVRLIAFSADGRRALVCSGHHSGSAGHTEEVVIDLSAPQPSVRRLPRFAPGAPRDVIPDDMTAAVLGRDGALAVGLDRHGVWAWATDTAAPFAPCRLPPMEARPSSLGELCRIVLGPGEDRVLAVVDNHVIGAGLGESEARVIARGAQAETHLLGMAALEPASGALVCVGGERARGWQPLAPFRVWRLDAEAGGLDAGPVLPGCPLWLSTDGARALCLTETGVGRQIVAFSIAEGRAIGALPLEASARFIDASADGSRLLLWQGGGYEVVDASASLS